MATNIGNPLAVRVTGLANGVAQVYTCTRPARVIDQVQYCTTANNGNPVVSVTTTTGLASSIAVLGTVVNEVNRLGFGDAVTVSASILNPANAAVTAGQTLTFAHATANEEFTVMSVLLPQ
jgi:hypothetical protein